MFTRINICEKSMGFKINHSYNARIMCTNNIMLYMVRKLKSNSKGRSKDQCYRQPEYSIFIKYPLPEEASKVNQASAQDQKPEPRI